jgi:hypothetical protein
VDVPGLHQAASNLRPRARQWHHSQMLPGDAGPNRNHGGPDRHAASSTHRGMHLGVFASPSPSSEGTQRDEPAQVGGGLPQTHPAALRSGMRMGFEAPEQRYHITPQQGRKRTDVYESSKMVHNHAEAVAMKESIKSNTAKLEKGKCILTRSKDNATINLFIDNMPCRDTSISQDSSLPTSRR